MASDLSTSKDQLREVKELLLRLINPISTPTAPHVNCSLVHTDSHSYPDPVEEPAILHGREPTASSHTNSRAEERHPMMPAQETEVVCCPSTRTTPNHRPLMPSVTQVLSPSCASGDTVPVTPNTMLHNFTNNMPIGAAVSTDMSVSAGTTSVDLSPHPIDRGTSRYEERCHVQPLAALTRNVHVGAQDGVTTRGMATTSEPPNDGRGLRLKLPLTLQPRDSSDPVAAHSLCFILHPDYGNTVVAEGRTDGSWKSPSGRFGSLCHEGEQMVQIHKILIPDLPLIFIEDRQPFSIRLKCLCKVSHEVAVEKK